MSEPSEPTDEQAGVELPKAPPPAAKKTNSGLLAAVLLIAAAAGIAALVLTNFKNESVYARGVDQLLGERDKWVGRSVRIEGVLVKGSLKFQEKPCEYQFDTTKGGQTLHVRFASCIKPDTLRDDMPEVGVTAEGKLQANGEFQASNVLAKCPSKYEMKDKKQGVSIPGPGPASLPQ